MPFSAKCRVILNQTFGDASFKSQIREKRERNFLFHASSLITLCLRAELWLNVAALQALMQQART